MWRSKLTMMCMLALTSSACGGDAATRATDVGATDTHVAVDGSDVDVADQLADAEAPLPARTGLVHGAGGAAWADSRHRLVVLVGRSEPAGVLESGGRRLTIGAAALLE